MTTSPSNQNGLFGLYSKIKHTLSSQMKKFGTLCLVNYIALYIVVFSTIYYLVKTDVLSSPVDPNKYLKNFWLKKRLLGENDLPEWCIDLATSWLINKATEPVRILVVIALTPMIAGMLPDGVRTFLVGKVDENEKEKDEKVEETKKTSVKSSSETREKMEATSNSGAARKRQIAK